MVLQRRVLEGEPTRREGGDQNRAPESTAGGIRQLGNDERWDQKRRGTDGMEIQSLCTSDTVKESTMRLILMLLWETTWTPRVGIQIIIK